MSYENGFPALVSLLKPILGAIRCEKFQKRVLHLPFMLVMEVYEMKSLKKEQLNYMELLIM